MLRSNGKAVLIDFGIAKELVPKTLSSKGIAGNEGFAPYEQMSRGSRDPTVDVYCLVATLYYGLTGQRPTTSLARKLDNTFLIPPKQINPSISDQLNQAILEGMALEAKDRPQSMQVWLAMLEAPKATPPPPVDRVHRKEVLPSKAKLSLKPILRVKPTTKPPRIIPWGWLIGVLLSYLLIGYLLAAFNAPHIIWAWAWAVAGAWAVAEAVAVAWAVAGAWASAVAVAGAWAVAWAVAVAGAWAMAVAGDKLLESFSKFHTFLILASTSSLGLGLGWLGHRIFNIGT
ncbi:hypothetical protein [Nostoc commune]|nr:hypothetical protein [Nostoc commune]